MSARDNILAKLRGSLQGTQPLADTFDESPGDRTLALSTCGARRRLRTLMETVHTETHRTTAADWPALVERVLAERGLDQLLESLRHAPRCVLVERWQGDGSPRWKAYDRPVEEWKAELFNDTRPANRHSWRPGLPPAAWCSGRIVRNAPDEPGAPAAHRPAQGSTVVDNFYELQQQHRWQDGCRPMPC